MDFSVLIKSNLRLTEVHCVNTPACMLLWGVSLHSFILFHFFSSVPLSLAASFSVFSTLPVWSLNVYFLHDSWSRWDQNFCTSLSVTRERGRGGIDKARPLFRHVHLQSLKSCSSGKFDLRALLQCVTFSSFLARPGWIPSVTFSADSVSAGRRLVKDGAPNTKQSQCCRWTDPREDSSSSSSGSQTCLNYSPLCRQRGAEHKWGSYWTGRHESDIDPHR